MLSLMVHKKAYEMILQHFVLLHSNARDVKDEFYFLPNFVPFLILENIQVILYYDIRLFCAQLVTAWYFVSSMLQDIKSRSMSR